jgi:hypothetical protein
MTRFTAAHYPDIPPNTMNKDYLEKIEKEFDLYWGVAPDGTPKHAAGEKAKSFLRAKLQEAYQQGMAEEAIGCTEHCKEAADLTLTRAIEAMPEEVGFPANTNHNALCSLWWW